MLRRTRKFYRGRNPHPRLRVSTCHSWGWCLYLTPRGWAFLGALIGQLFYVVWLVWSQNR